MFFKVSNKRAEAILLQTEAWLNMWFCAYVLSCTVYSAQIPATSHKVEYGANTVLIVMVWSQYRSSIEGAHDH